MNHYGKLLFSLPNLSKINCVNASNWSYNDDIDIETDEDDPQQEEGGDEGGTTAGMPHDKEIHKPPMTQSRSTTSPSGLNEAHFCQYLNDQFCKTHLLYFTLT